MKINIDAAIEASLLKTRSLEPRKLELAVANLMERYHYLHLTQASSSNEKKEAKTYSFEVKEADQIAAQVINDDTTTAWCDNLCAQLDPVHGPIVSVGLMKGQTQDTDWLFIAIHGKFADRVAWRVFVSELYACYYGYALPKVQNDYAQWLYTLRAYAKEPIVQQNHLDFWCRTVDKIRQSNWPSQFSQGASSASYQTSIIKIDRDVLQKLKSLYTENASGTGLKEICLSAMLYALSKVLEQQQIPCMIFEAGRQHLYKTVDPARLMGNCQVSFPVIFGMDHASLSTVHPYHDILNHVIEQKNSQPPYGLSYTALHLFHPDATVREQLSLDILPISFHYLGQYDQLDPYTDWRIDARYPGWNNTFSNGQHKLSVSFLIDDDQLYLHILHQESFISKAMVRALSTQMRTYLYGLAEEDRAVIRTSQSVFRSCVKRYEPFLVLNKEQLGSTPIIFVPPGGGGAESYLNVLQEMQIKHERIILLNNYLNDSGDLVGLPTTFEALAAICIQHLRGQGISKGVRLAGYSFGGALAFEMANQLELYGVSVKDLYLIDPIFVGDFVNDEELIEYKKLRRDIEFISHYRVNKKRLPNANIHFFKSTKAVYFGDNPDINEQKIIRALDEPLNGLTLPMERAKRTYHIETDHYQLLSAPFVQQIMSPIFDRQQEDVRACI